MIEKFTEVVNELKTYVKKITNFNFSENENSCYEWRFFILDKSDRNMFIEFKISNFSTVDVKITDEEYRVYIKNAYSNLETALKDLKIKLSDNEFRS